MEMCRTLAECAGKASTRIKEKSPLPEGNGQGSPEERVLGDDER
jgi:hypothetical protein